MKDRPVVEKTYEDILREAYRTADSIMHSFENIRHFLNESKTLSPTWSDVATLGHIAEKLKEFDTEVLDGYHRRLLDADWDEIERRAEEAKKKAKQESVRGRKEK